MKPTLVACLLGLSIGCHRKGVGQAIVPVPAGLDSAGVARWVSEQRAACSGHLVSYHDEGGGTRDFDSVPPRRSYRYVSTVLGVSCRR
jgi:hypothetical protein